MNNFFKTFVNFVFSFFAGRRIEAVKNKTESYLKTIDPFKKAVKKRFRRMGRLIWDPIKRGTFKRSWKKIGRNDLCPCGRMRDEPRDITKRMKYKFCCGR